jgi:hypothetical protein
MARARPPSWRRTTRGLTASIRRPADEVAARAHGMHALTDSDLLAHFAAAWERSFLLAPPLGYRMREMYPAR